MREQERQRLSPLSPGAQSSSEADEDQIRWVRTVGCLASPEAHPSWHPTSPRPTQVPRPTPTSFSAQGEARGFPAEAARRAGVSASREGQLGREKQADPGAAQGRDGGFRRESRLP